MAESSYMQLLDHGAKVTSDAFNRIDQAMTRTLEVQQRAGQFQTEMTAKAAMFGEQTRMNDATIENMKADNYIKGQEFALKQQLIPLQIEEQNLRMQALKEQHATRAEASKFNQFNQITQAYEPMIKGEILRTMSPDEANEFGTYRGKWMAHVANGGGFDGSSYQKGLDDIMKKYQHVQATEKEWNAQDRFLLAQVHPDLAQAYDLKNPQLKSHKNGLASTYIGLEDGEASKFIGQYKALYTDHEWGQIAPVRRIVTGNEQQIKANIQEMSRLQTQLAGDITEDRAVRINSQIKDLDSRTSALRDINQAYTFNIANGNYGELKKQVSPEDQSAALEKARKEKEAEERAKRTAEAGEKPGGFTGPTAAIDTDREMARKRVAKVGLALSHDQGEDAEPIRILDMGHINLNWFAENAQEGEINQSTKEFLVESFNENMEEAQKRASGDVNRFLNEEGFNKLFALIDGSIDMPLTNYIKGGPRSEYYGYKSLPAEENEFGMGSSTGYENEPSSIVIGKTTLGKSVSSFSDINKILRSEKNSEKRTQLAKDLYAIVAAAATAKAVERK